MFCFYPIMPLFLSHVAVEIGRLCSVYIVYGAMVFPSHTALFLNAGEPQFANFDAVISLV